MEKMIEVDGSFGEGGGQIIRTAVALSAATGKPCHVFNIRKGRPNPGLQAQHLTAVRAVGDICSAGTDGMSLHSTEFTFEPGKVSGGAYSWDIGTAGSVTLVLQALLPAALHSGKEFDFTVKGGTNVPWSPPVEFFQHVFCDFLKKMGAKIIFSVSKYGFYPKGGGIVKVQIMPSDMKSLDIKERGAFEKIDVWSIASSGLKTAKVAERQVAGFRKLMAGGNLGKINVLYDDSDSPGSAIHAHLCFENCRLGAEALGEKKKAAELVGNDCAKKLLIELNSGFTVDENLLDQILPYLALYGGVLRSGELTNHAKTNIWVIEKFLPIRFYADNGFISVKNIA